MLSAIWFGRPLDDSVAQVISATTFGVGYAGMRIHTVSVWPLAVLHGLDDWTSVNSRRDAVGCPARGGDCLDGLRRWARAPAAAADAVELRARAPMIGTGSRR